MEKIGWTQNLQGKIKGRDKIQIKSSKTFCKLRVSTEAFQRK
jgi:hypothetical protein